MKKLIIALVLLIVGSIGSFAQSMIKVSVVDKQVINVALDGRYFNKKGTSVTVGDLPPGDHYLQVYEVIQKRNGRGRETVVYEGKVTTDNGMITVFGCDPETGETTSQEQTIDSYLADHPLPVAKNDNGNYGNNSGAPAAPVHDNATLTDTKTNDLKTLVAERKTDTEKMKVLKDALQNEKVTTDQVANMMDWFNFESSKVDFAKWAYGITVDKENYWGLDTKFTYKNYQDDFDSFMKSKN